MDTELTKRVMKEIRCCQRENYAYAASLCPDGVFTREAALQSAKHWNKITRGLQARVRRQLAEEQSE